jgi:hypothetical protein
MDKARIAKLDKETLIRLRKDAHEAYNETMTRCAKILHMLRKNPGDTELEADLKKCEKRLETIGDQLNIVEDVLEEKTGSYSGTGSYSNGIKGGRRRNHKKTKKAKRKSRHYSRRN